MNTINENRKGYKKTKIGWIPKKWKIEKLKKFTSVITKGTTPTSLGFTYKESGINFIKIESITENLEFKASKFNYIDAQTNKVLNRSILKNGDILFSIAGALGKIGFVTENILPANTNQALAIIRLKTKKLILQKYFLYVFQSFYKKKYISKITTTGAQPNMSLADLGNFLVIIPPEKEYLKITQILSICDKNIQKTKKLINAKLQLKKSFMELLFTGNKRFKEFKKDKWKNLKINDVTDVMSSNVDKKSHENETKVFLCNYLDVYNNNYINNAIDFMEATANDNEIKRFSLLPDDVIITNDSETPNDIASSAVVIEPLENVICGYHLSILRPNKNKITGLFLNQLLKKYLIRICKIIKKSESIFENTNIEMPFTLLFRWNNVFTYFEKNNCIDEYNKSIDIQPNAYLLNLIDKDIKYLNIILEKFTSQDFPDESPYLEISQLEPLISRNQLYEIYIKINENNFINNLDNKPKNALIKFCEFYEQENKKIDS